MTTPIEKKEGELFSQSQIDILRRIGVRVEYCGSKQAVFNDWAVQAEIRIQTLRGSITDAIITLRSSIAATLSYDDTHEI
jgi:hypothetical protein